jgi:thiol-disulfide isomerase/thioredoxin
LESTSHRCALRGRRYRALALALFSSLLLLLATACSGSAGASKDAATDFNFVSYNTAGVLPEGQGSFSQVLALNKPVVLNFWGGDCPPCRAEMPDFQQVADQYQGKVIFLGIDVGPFTQLGTHDSARTLLKDLNITYPTAYAVDDKPLVYYNLPGIPTTVLITKDHTIMATKSGIMSKSDLLSDVKTLVSK